VTPSTHFLQDILRQPEEMLEAIAFLTGAGEKPLREASELIKSSDNVLLTGIGASWHAAMGAGSLLQTSGKPACLREAGELLHFAAIPSGSVIIAISRTGRSIEIVQLLEKARKVGAPVIGVTNSSDGPLARESKVALVIPTRMDHAISVNTYSTPLIAAAALGASVTGNWDSIVPGLKQAIEALPSQVEIWKTQLETTKWLKDSARYYFLARGGSIGTCHEARLLWEEGAKTPATAMSTSGFRHGPQEIVRPGVRFGMWIDQSQMREQDLAVAADLRELGASVMLVGENLPSDAADLVCHLPASPPNWQFAIDAIPAQLAAERMSRLAGVDCDSFRVCSYVVEDEHGLLRRKTEASPNAG